MFLQKIIDEFKRIQNIKNGEEKTLKFKIAVPLISSGEWILIEKM